MLEKHCDVVREDDAEVETNTELNSKGSTGNGSGHIQQSLLEQAERNNSQNAELNAVDEEFTNFDTDDDNSIDGNGGVQQRHSERGVSAGDGEGDIGGEIDGCQDDNKGLSKTGRDGLHQSDEGDGQQQGSATCGVFGDVQTTFVFSSPASSRRQRRLLSQQQNTHTTPHTTSLPFCSLEEEDLVPVAASRRVKPVCMGDVWGVSGSPKCFVVRR